MTIAIQLLDRVINCMVTMIVLGINDGDCRSYYKFIYGYCLSFIHVLIIYLSITSSELIFYDINQCIKQYFNDLNDEFDAIQSEMIKNIYQYIIEIYMVYQLIVF